MRKNLVDKSGNIKLSLRAKESIEIDKKISLNRLEIKGKSNSVIKFTAPVMIKNFILNGGCVEIKSEQVTVENAEFRLGRIRSTGFFMNIKKNLIVDVSQFKGGNLKIRFIGDTTSVISSLCKTGNALMFDNISIAKDKSYNKVIVDESVSNLFIKKIKDGISGVLHIKKNVNLEILRPDPLIGNGTILFEGNELSIPCLITKGVNFSVIGTKENYVIIKPNRSTTFSSIDFHGNTVLKNVKFKGASINGMTFNSPVAKLNNVVIDIPGEKMKRNYLKFTSKPVKRNNDADSGLAKTTLLEFSDLYTDYYVDAQNINFHLLPDYSIEEDFTIIEFEAGINANIVDVSVNDSLVHGIVYYYPETLLGKFIHNNSPYESELRSVVKIGFVDGTNCDIWPKQISLSDFRENIIAFTEAQYVVGKYDYLYDIAAQLEHMQIDRAYVIGSKHFLKITYAYLDQNDSSSKTLVAVDELAQIGYVLSSRYFCTPDDLKEDNFEFKKNVQIGNDFFEILKRKMSANVNDLEEKTIVVTAPNIYIPDDIKPDINLILLANNIRGNNISIIRPGITRGYLLYELGREDYDPGIFILAGNKCEGIKEVRSMPAAQVTNVKTIHLANLGTSCWYDEGRCSIDIVDDLTEKEHAISLGVEWCNESARPDAVSELGYVCERRWKYLYREIPYKITLPKLRNDLYGGVAAVSCEDTSSHSIILTGAIIPRIEVRNLYHDFGFVARSLLRRFKDEHTPIQCELDQDPDDPYPWGERDDVTCEVVRFFTLIIEDKNSLLNEGQELRQTWDLWDFDRDFTNDDSLRNDISSWLVRHLSLWEERINGRIRDPDFHEGFIGYTWNQANAISQMLLSKGEILRQAYFHANQESLRNTTIGNEWYKYPHQIIRNLPNFEEDEFPMTIESILGIKTYFIEKIKNRVRYYSESDANKRVSINAIDRMYGQLSKGWYPARDYFRIGYGNRILSPMDIKETWADVKDVIFQLNQYIGDIEREYAIDELLGFLDRAKTSLENVARAAERNRLNKIEAKQELIRIQSKIKVNHARLISVLSSDDVNVIKKDGPPYEISDDFKDKLEECGAYTGDGIRENVEKIGNAFDGVKDGLDEVSDLIDSEDWKFVLEQGREVFKYLGFVGAALDTVLGWIYEEAPAHCDETIFSGIVTGLETAIALLQTMDAQSGALSVLANALDGDIIFIATVSHEFRDMADSAESLRISLQNLKGEELSREGLNDIFVCANNSVKAFLHDMYTLNQMLHTTLGKAYIPSYLKIPDKPFWPSGDSDCQMKYVKYASKGFGFSLWDNSYFNVSSFTNEDGDTIEEDKWLTEAIDRFKELTDEEICGNQPVDVDPLIFVVRKTMNLEELFNNGKVDFSVTLDDLVRAGNRRSEATGGNLNIIEANVGSSFCGDFKVSLSSPIVLGIGYKMLSDGTNNIQLFLVNSHGSFAPSLGCEPTDKGWITSNIKVTGEDKYISTCLKTLLSSPQVSELVPFDFQDSDYDIALREVRQLFCIDIADVALYSSEMGLPLLGTWHLIFGSKTTAGCFADALYPGNVSNCEFDIPSAEIRNSIQQIDIIFVAAVQPVKELQYKLVTE